MTDAGALENTPIRRLLKAAALILAHIERPHARLVVCKVAATSPLTVAPLDDSAAPLRPASQPKAPITSTWVVGTRVLVATDGAAAWHVLHEVA